MKKLALILGIAVLAASAQADILIDANIQGVGADEAVTQGLPTNQLVAWVAAGDDGVFSYSDSNVLGADGFTIAGSDDVLLGIGDSGGTFASISGGQIFKTDPAASHTGEALGVLFFVTPFDADATGVGEGVLYGFWNTGELVPADGSSDLTVAVTTTVFGGNAPALAPEYTTIPEPFTMGVLAVGGLAMLRRRRAA